MSGIEISMNLIERTSDILGFTSMEDLGGLVDFPVFMGCTDESPELDLKAAMLWHISPETGVLQLRKLVPLDVLYGQSHDSGAIGKIWMTHHEAFADFVFKINPSSVLEIGGAHGILSKKYIEKDSRTDWMIVEPNPIPAEGVTTRFIKGFFDDQFELNEEVDAVVHSHVFEHVYDPQTFVKHIAKFLSEGKHLIFSLPNMEVMLQRKYTNCINFEHTVFLTEPYVEYLLHQHGFRILEKEYFLDDHSIFYACVRDNNVEPTALPKGLYQKNKQTYLEYVRYHEELISELNQKITKLEDSQKLYLFGAHVFAQYLIAFGLDTSRIERILDNDPNKQGKRLYGTSLQVASPNILADVENPVVILKAGAYNEEIKIQIGRIRSDAMFL